MKKIYILFFLLLTAVFSVYAQSNTGIRFQENKSWKKILRQAKKENKLVFVDCYASWCVPCMRLSKRVFIQDSVGDYFNRHFVCVKFDMEKEEQGKSLKGKYKVVSYPTLLFIDPETEDVRHRLAGAGTADWLLGRARQAVDPDHCLGGLERQYMEGKRDQAFLGEYYHALEGANLQKELLQVGQDYLESIPEDVFVSKENWDIILKYLKDPLSASFRKFLSGRKEFSKLVGKDVVELKLSSLIRMSAINFVNTYLKNHRMDSERFRQLVDCFRHIDNPGAPAGLAYLYTLDFVSRKDYKGMFQKMDEARSYNLFRSSDEISYMDIFMKALISCDDPDMVREGVRLIDKFVTDTGDVKCCYGLLRTKCRLLLKLGDKAAADKVEKRLNELFKPLYR